MSPGAEKMDGESEKPGKEDSKMEGEGKDGNKEAEEKEVTVWKYEEQQEVEEVPAEIQFLEEFAEKHGFVGR